MSEGFGQLANLQKLGLEHCYELAGLPESKSHQSHHLESFYFSVIFDVRRLWAAGQPPELNTFGAKHWNHSQKVSRIFLK